MGAVQTYKLPWDPERLVYPDCFKVIAADDFMSKLVTNKKFQKNQVITAISGASLVKEKSWTTVQVSKDAHIELNSELTFMNHSCDPSIKIDTENMQIVALRDLDVGEDVTFFYPSTEWDMSKPFECNCKSKACIGIISGAKHIAKEKLDKFFINNHILEQIKAQTS